MKKPVVSFALVLVVLFCAWASSAAEAGDMHYGIKAGPNLSFAYAEGGRADFMVAPAGGVFMNYNLSKVFQIQPEVLYMGRGWDETAGSLTLTNKINYIDINLLLKLLIRSGGESVMSSFGVGPYVGMKISDSYEFNVSVPSAVDTVMTIIYDELKSYDAGIVFSGEINVLLDNGGMVVLDFRSTVGLVSLFGDITVGQTTFNVVDIKNVGFQFMVGYAF
jgi:hypothetical protein